MALKILCADGTQQELGTATLIKLLSADGTWQSLTMEDPTDLIQAETYKTKMVRQEAVAVGDGNTLTIASIAGSGIVTSIFVAASGAGWRDAMLKIYVGGEGTPSVQFDFGTLGYHWGADTAFFSCDHMSIEWVAGSQQLGMEFRFPIPFSGGIRVDVHAASGAITSMYTQVFYTSDITEGRRLKSAGITYVNKATVVAASGDYELMNYNSGRGTLVWHSMILDGVGGDNSYIESDVKLTIDGSLDIQSTGLEDWFGGAWNWSSTVRSSPWAYCSVLGGGWFRTAIGLDVLKLHGGIQFNSSLKIDLATDEWTGNTDLSYLLLYYTGAP